MNKLLTLALGTLLFVGAAVCPGHAQTAVPYGAVDPGHPRVNEVDRRERTQAGRIAQGQRSGQLTRGETARLERREGNIERTKERDMRRHGGHLTRSEQRSLNRRQNRLSRSIKRDKHNARVQ